MSIYTLALFVHIVGAIGVFVGVSVWLFAAAALRRTQYIWQVRALTSLIQPSGNLAVGSMLLLGAAGLYLALTVWGWQTPWIDVATISFVLLAPFGARVIDPRMRAMSRAANEAPAGPLPPSLAVRIHDPIVGIGLHLYVAVLLGIVFLMTTKPALVASILAMVVAAALGLASGLPLWWAARPRSRDIATRAPSADQRGRGRPER